MPVPKRTPGDLMTVDQVAAYLQFNKLTVYKFIRTGDLPAVRLGRSFRIRRVDVDQFLEAHMVTPKHTRSAAAGTVRRPDAPLRQPAVQRREPASVAESAESAARREERRRLREAMISSNPLEWVIRGLH